MPQAGFLVIGLAILLGAGVAIWLFGHRADAERRARFRERPVLEPQELLRRFYPGNEVSVASIDQALGLISKATGIPRGQLRPGDRFGAELAPARGWEFDDALNEVSWFLESRKKGSSAGLQSVDDVIRAVDRPDRE